MKGERAWWASALGVGALGGLILALVLLTFCNDPTTQGRTESPESPYAIYRPSWA